METAHSRESDLAYLKQLLGAVWGGIASARYEIDGAVFTPPLQNIFWKPTAIGATLGVLSARVNGDRQPASKLVMRGLAGGVLGFAAALAWGSRRFTSLAARRAIRRVGATRDAHWLETHPIDYA